VRFCDGFHCPIIERTFQLELHLHFRHRKTE
jgi:hypothetical protein